MSANNWILGLDVGDVRVGLALVDRSTLTPFPHSTLLRARGYAEQQIMQLCRERLIKTVVVGLPLSENGEENPQCEKVRNFIRRLQKRIDVTVTYVDEYLSSEEAQQRLSVGQRGRIDAEKIDAIAAVIVLERYLASSHHFSQV